MKRTIAALVLGAMLMMVGGIGCGGPSTPAKPPTPEKKTEPEKPKP